MTLGSFLETFETPNAARKRQQEEPGDAERLEQARSEGFEAGYTSGWEDAKKAEADSRFRVEAEFERNIQNLAFTYNEAVDRVRGELKTFVAALVHGFFPEIVPDLLREHVRAELLKVADDMVEVPIEIVTSPDCSPLLTDMLQSDFSLQIELVEDESLAARQVFIRIAEREIEVNITPLLTALKAQFNAVSKPNADRIANDGR